MRESQILTPAYRRALRVLLIVVPAAVGVWLFFSFLFEPLLPFLLAAAIAALLQKPLFFLEKRLGHRRYTKPLCSAFLVILVFGAFFALGALFIGHLFSEGRLFAASFADDLSHFTSMLDRTLGDISDFFKAQIGGEAPLGDGPFSAVIDSLDAYILDILGSALSAVTARLPSLVGRIMAAMPRIFIFFGVWFMATLYLTPAWHGIGVFITKYFPEKSAALLRGVRSTLVSTLLLYAKAYAILITLTFFELFVGFSILGIPYTFALALGIALIDILPVLGVGTVLIPWSLLSFVWEDTRLGVGLLVLYAVISVVRQICEPRIVGKKIGLPPLLALFSVYIGARLFGAWGLFLLPIALAVTLRYLEEKREKEASAPKTQPDTHSAAPTPKGTGYAVREKIRQT